MSRSSTPALPMYNASRQDLAPPDHTRPPLTRLRTPVSTSPISFVFIPPCPPRAPRSACASTPKCHMVENCLLTTHFLAANRHSQPCSPYTSGDRYSSVHLADTWLATQ
ncbi:hypothetical protein KCU66_g16222, partial [Aureobasidium melanogenum]